MRSCIILSVFRLIVAIVINPITRIFWPKVVHRVVWSCLAVNDTALGLSLLPSAFSKELVKRFDSVLASSCKFELIMLILLLVLEVERQVSQHKLSDNILRYLVKLHVLWAFRNVWDVLVVCMMLVGYVRICLRTRKHPLTIIIMTLLACSILYIGKHS